MSEAQDEIARLLPGTDHPAPHGARVTTRYEQETESARGPLWVLLAVSGLLLLVACGNVGNLLLGEIAVRQHEIAIRAALGAGWGRIARQLLTESALLSIAGGMAGLPIAVWGTRAIILLAPRQLPRFEEVGIDYRILLLMLSVAFVSALIFGLAPILVVRRSVMEKTIKNSHGTRMTRRWPPQNLIVVGEIMLSFVLLVSAGLLTRSLIALSSVDPGFQSSNLLVIRPTISYAKYRGQMQSFYNEALERLRATPGVLSVSAISIQPFGTGVQDNYIEIKGRPLAPGNPGLIASIPDAAHRHFRGCCGRDGRLGTVQRHFTIDCPAYS